MTPYLPYDFWRTIIAAHQWLQCGQLRPFPAPCMIALLGALARVTARSPTASGGQFDLFRGF